MLGAIYGGASLWLDAPPMPGDHPPGGIAAAQWQPSPAWLPSFLSIRLGIGIQPTPEGYVFTGRSGHALFGSATIVFGMLLFGILGWFGGEVIRKVVVRRERRSVYHDNATNQP